MRSEHQTYVDISEKKTYKWPTYKHIRNRSASLAIRSSDQNHDRPPPKTGATSARQGHAEAGTCLLLVGLSISTTAVQTLGDSSKTETPGALGHAKQGSTTKRPSCPDLPFDAATPLLGTHPKETEPAHVTAALLQQPKLRHPQRLNGAQQWDTPPTEEYCGAMRKKPHHLQQHGWHWMAVLSESRRQR